VLAGALAGAFIFEIPLTHPPRVGDLASSTVNPEFAERQRFLLPSLLKATYLSLLVVALHAVFEANRRAAAALHAARMQALDTEKEVFEGELRAMQTRIDPDLLFDSLKDIDAAYAKDPAAGQSWLDALIRFLRAALPARSTAIPTVGHEKELTEAYLDLLAIRHATQPQLEFTADSAALGEKMPPMLLLPLVKWASDVGLADELRIEVRRLETGPTDPGPCLELTIDSRLSRAPDGDGEELEILRYRLRRLHGDCAHLVTATAGIRRHAVLVLPLGAGN
jgi:LytS/YehU family sensor histidine kinase